MFHDFLLFSLFFVDFLFINLLNILIGSGFGNVATDLVRILFHQFYYMVLFGYLSCFLTYIQNFMYRFEKLDTVEKLCF